MKFFKLLILPLIFIACKSKKEITYTANYDQERLSMISNDSVAKFNIYDRIIAKKVEGHTSLANPFTLHFKKHITSSALNSVEFKEWRRQIYIEFSIDKWKRVTYLNTNTASKKLDKQLKKAFKKLDLNLFQFPKFDSRYKYTLIVVQQNYSKQPIIKCSQKIIGYIPPVFEPCQKEISYQGLNNCNYIYITNYIYNNIDVSLADFKDINNKHNIIPKFIIDKNGKVIAAKIESHNKEFIENYYKTLKSLPKAMSPAKINNQPFYYGYTFPSTIANIVRNNDGFQRYFEYEKNNGKSLSENIKAYIQLQIDKKEKERIYRVGF